MRYFLLKIRLFAGLAGCSVPPKLVDRVRRCATELGYMAGRERDGGSLHPHRCLYSRFEILNNIGVDEVSMWWLLGPGADGRSIVRQDGREQQIHPRRRR